MLTNLVNQVEGKRHNAEVIDDHWTLEVEGLAVFHQPRSQQRHKVDVSSDDERLRKRSCHKQPVLGPWIYKPGKKDVLFYSQLQKSYRHRCADDANSPASLIHSS